MSDTRQVAQEFFETAFINRDPAAAAEQFFGDENYKQHNPEAPDGAEGFVGAISGLFEAFPDFSIDLKRVIVEDDLAVFHFHRKLTKDELGAAVVDIFRVSNGKIVEHWDVVQNVPEKPANDNTMF